MIETQEIRPKTSAESPANASRSQLLDRLRRSESDRWDVIVVGGGATGLGTAVDAASRGYRTLLLESHDFASGTSSKATKLVHGGVRYLAQGQVAMVREALRERSFLLRNAPYLTRSQGFVIPAYGRLDKVIYGLGLKVYDAIAGKSNLAPCRLLSIAETLRALPNVRQRGLRGGILYFDGQFDDARLAIALVRTAADMGGLLLNYVAVIGLLKNSSAGKQIVGVRAEEMETGEKFVLRGRCVINATGVWVDALRKTDDPKSTSILSPSQGAHLVLGSEFLPGDYALLVPRTEDGRVLFAVPWLGHTVVGTTDTPRSDLALDAPAADAVHESRATAPLDEEVDFILRMVAPHLAHAPTRSHVLSAWAGLRPLVRENSSDTKGTSNISREHSVIVSQSGLVTVTGGKWTTYRRMAEVVLDVAIEKHLLERRPCRTENLVLHGADGSTYKDDSELAMLGSATQAPNSATVGLTEGMVRYAARHEYALTVEDVLARRHRALLLNARAAVGAAPWVAAIMREERGQNDSWADEQIRAFTLEARKYLISAGRN